MELLILSHFEDASDFRTFASLITEELSDSKFFFIKEEDKILFFGEPVYHHDFLDDDIVFENGILLNGKKEGYWISWYDNRKKHFEGFYRNGKEEGFCTYFAFSGKKIVKVYI